MVGCACRSPAPRLTTVPVDAGPPRRPCRRPTSKTPPRLVTACRSPTERDVDEPPTTAAAAATALGFPVVVKLSGDAIAHKTERGLVRLGWATRDAVEQAAAELLAAATPADGDVSSARRADGRRQPRADRRRACAIRQFGPTVMLGVGGVLAEAVADVVFRPAPLDRSTPTEMIDDARDAEAARARSAASRRSIATRLVDRAGRARAARGRAARRR